ncbi:MAG: hypothetical protein JWM97_522, partial [Phycisphaerales bacterium]|nr:hypothetical protein [Phycisphaerales bacterium]
LVAQSLQYTLTLATIDHVMRMYGIPLLPLI